MRKIFTLFAAMLLALTVFAADQYPKAATTNSLSEAFSAVGNGETVWLEGGTYTNAKGVDYTYLSGSGDKSFTVRAIENQSPIIQLEVPFVVKENANVKFIGVKFDGSNIHSDYSFYFDIIDNTNNVLEFDRCEFTSISKYVVRVRDGKKAAKISLANCNSHDITNRIINQGTTKEFIIKDSKFKTYTAAYPIIDNYDSGIIENLTITGCEFDDINYGIIHNTSGAHVGKCVVNNCYFHDSKRTAIFFEAPASAQAQVDSIAITNSTFENYTNPGDYTASIIDIRNGGSQTALGKVLVDHCTFYDCQTINYDHTCVRVHKSTDAVISNCIFKTNGDYERCATHLYGGAIKNCIAHNYTHEYATRWGHYSGATFDACSTANPLFIDAANGDLALSLASPAIGAATDGSNIGDPNRGVAKRLYCKMEYTWWTDGDQTGPAAIGAYAYIDANNTIKNAEFPGVRMTRIEENSPIWTIDLSPKYDKVIFTRVNSVDPIANWGAQTANLDIPTNNNFYTITSSTAQWKSDNNKTVTGTWSIKDAKYYIHGTVNNWDTSDKIGSTTDSYVFKNLAAGTHKFKVVDGESWMGFNMMTDTAKCLFADQDANICFVLAEAGDVTLTYAKENSAISTFNVRGTFSLPQVVVVGNETVFGGWTAETGTVLVPAADSLTASATIIPAYVPENYYEFKISLNGGDLLGRNGDNDSYCYINRTYQAISNLRTDHNKSIRFVPDMAGKEYVFTWNYAKGELTVPFPSNDPTAVENTVDGKKAQKMIENGRMVIIKNGVRYNVLGQVER